MVEIRNRYLIVPFASLTVAIAGTGMGLWHTDPADAPTGLAEHAGFTLGLLIGTALVAALLTGAGLAIQTLAPRWIHDATVALIRANDARRDARDQRRAVRGTRTHGPATRAVLRTIRAWL